MIDSRADLYSPEFNTKTKNVSDGNDIFMDVQNIATGKDDYKKYLKLWSNTCNNIL